MQAAPKLESLRCPICSRIFTAPVIVQCGHTFCRECLDNWKTSGQESANLCPLCREPIGEYVAVNRALADAIAELAKPCNECTVKRGAFKFNEQTDCIGEGGIAKVFKGQYDGQPVAIKRIKVANLSGDEFLRSFHAEARALRAVQHPNIVKFYGTCQDGNDFFIITELAGNGSLFDAIHKRKQFAINWTDADSVRSFFRIASGIVNGLRHLHDQGFIHRDLKSANVLLTETRDAKVCDFGLACLTSSTTTTIGNAVGTLRWLPPESLEIAVVDKRCDVWSLGVIFQVYIFFHHHFHCCVLLVVLSCLSHRLVSLHVCTQAIPQWRAVRHCVIHSRHIERASVRTLAHCAEVTTAMRFLPLS